MVWMGLGRCEWDINQQFLDDNKVDSEVFAKEIKWISRKPNDFSL